MNEGNTAEKKSFKNKWDNYWYYYKIHTWIGIFVVIVLAVTITQCVQTVKPDVTIDFVTSVPLTDSTIEFDGVFDDVISDVNNDEKKHIGVTTLYLTGKAQSEQDMAMEQKMMLELAAGDVTLFIFDQKNLERYITQDAYSPLSDFIDIEPYKDIEGKLVEHNGTVYAISLKGSQKLAEMGFATDDLYGIFRFVPEKAAKDEKKMMEYENAAAILTELLK